MERAAAADAADAALLATLQLADSAFPSGAYTLSGGLETLIEEGLVRDAAGLAGCVRAALLGRAARGDLAALVAAQRAADVAMADDLPEITTMIAIDHRLDATKLAAEDRQGSRRVGRRVALEVERLTSSPTLARFREAIESGATPGTAAVVHGVAAAAMSIPEQQAALAAAHAYVLGLLGVGVRLGRIGHGDQQRLLRDAREVIVRAVEIARATDWRTLRPFAPGLDVAMARHEIAAGRLFAS
jgi:urease accessory protein